MISLATEHQRQLLAQAQLANQQIDETITTLLANLQANPQMIADQLKSVQQQLAQQRTSQQQIEQLIADQPCSASKLIFDQVNQQPSGSGRCWIVSREPTHVSLPPRLIGGNNHQAHTH